MKVQELIDLLKDETHSSITGKERQINLIADGKIYHNVDLEIIGVEFGAFVQSIDLEVKD